MCPECCAPHDGQDGLGHPQRAKQVGLDLRASLLLADLLDCAEQTVTGVVDRDIDAPEPLVCLLNRGIDRPFVPDVERERQKPVAVFHLQLIERADIAGRGGHAVAARQCSFRPDVAKAFGCACDEPGFVRSGFGHGILSSETLS